MQTKLLKVRSVFKFLFVLVILIFSLSELYQVVVTQAKKELISNLSHLSSQKVSVGTLAFRLPATVLIKNIEIGGRKDQKSLSISQASVSLAPFASLRKRQPVFSRIQIVEPSLFYEIEESKKTSAPSSSRAKVFPAVQKMEITKGSIEFIDRRFSGRKLGITVSGLNVSIILQDRTPGARIVKFSAQAGLLQGEQSPKGKISINGWTDIDSRITQARIDIRDLDGIYLYPYYSEWVHFEKARFQKAQFDFSADITGTGNKYDAACRLELTQSEFEPLAQGQSPDQPQKLAMLGIEIFKALDQGRVFVDFNLKFDADKPGLDWTPLSSAFSEKIKNGFVVKPADAKDALKLPEHVVRKTAATLGGITKNVFGQTAELGRQLTQSVQDTFIKVTPKKEN